MFPEAKPRRTLRVEVEVEVEVESLIKCFVIPPNSKVGRYKFSV